MRLFGPAGLTIALLAGCAGGGEVHGPHHPGPIPYRCGDGQLAQITYENGGWFVRARAHLVWGGRTSHLQASPPTYGLRYVSADDAADTILVWTARGEEAWISEIARDPSANAPEREVAHCTRVRDGVAAPLHAGDGEHH